MAKYKPLLLFGLLAVNVAAVNAAQPKAVELIAQNIYQEGNTTRANGDVLLRDSSQFLRSDYLILCKESGEAELFGNVYLSQPNQDVLIGDYLKLGGGPVKRGWIDNLFTQSNESGLWLAGNEGHMEGNITTVRQGSVSGCPAAAPDWSIRFSSARLDRQEAWVDLYNPRFYAGHVPVFYMPYFGYSTNMARRSGLLFPRFGQSSEEGTLFEIPYYLAPYDQWDLELWPQTRSRRGDGLAGTFRFVDSRHSKGTVNLGQFKDKPAFAEEKGLENANHWGGSIAYERTRVLSSAGSSHQEGLIAEYQDYSDVEYIQLESVDPDKREREINALITNKLDYFYKTDGLYGGFYTRHFNDLSTQADESLVHIAPESHGHLFNRPLLFDNLLVSADLRHRNYERKSGVEATDWRLNVPVGYHFSLIEDYLLVSALWQGNYYRIDYTEPGYQTGIHSQSQASVSVSTLLARPYSQVFHTLGAGITYTDPLTQSQEGQFDGNFSSNVDTSEATRHETAAFGLSQYLHDSAGLAVLSHRLSQPVILDENNTLLDLQNELILQPRSDISLSNRSRWSHEYDALTSSTTTFSKKGTLAYSLTYLYANKTGNKVTNRYLSASAGYQLSRRHRFFGNFARDLLSDETRGWQVGYTYNKGCWQTILSFTRKITPYTTAGGDADSTINDIIFLKLTLVPLGEVEQQLYEQERG